MPREKRGNGERGPDKRPRKGSPRLGKPSEEGAAPPDQRPSRARRDKALDLLCEGLSPREVAKRLKVNPSTVYDWLKEERFATALDARLEEGRQAALKVLKASASGAAETLRKVADRGNQYHGPRVKAAEAILDRIGLTVTKEVKVTMDATVKDVSVMSEEELAAERARLAGKVGG